ncbi:MAG TPA: phage late control D family protein [Rhodanobacteraceae bacterium]|nr:phage late control D family protein [Rhodanobacteraceae bacterium]
MWNAFGRCGFNKLQSGDYRARDYNFTMPKADLATVDSTPAGHPHDSYPVYDFPGIYTELGEGEPLTRVRLEELQARHRRSRSCAGFVALGKRDAQDAQAAVSVAVLMR